MPLFLSKSPFVSPKKSGVLRRGVNSSQRQVVTQTTPTTPIEARSPPLKRPPKEDYGGQPSDGPFDTSVLILRVFDIFHERSGNIWLSQFRDYFLDVLTSSNMSPGFDDEELKKAIRNLEEGIQSWVSKYEKSSLAVANSDLISVTDDFLPYNLTLESPVWGDPSFSCQLLKHLFLNCLMCKEFEDKDNRSTNCNTVQSVCLTARSASVTQHHHSI
jgi:hypothetical protein